MSKKREFDATRKLQDEEYELALFMEAQKQSLISISSDSKPTKKPKICAAPKLLTNPNIRLKIRICSGKIIACSFNENELIKTVVQQLKWLFQSMESLYLVFNTKVLPMSESLLQCGIVDRTTLFANS
jgi:hypothetical protein